MNKATSRRTDFERRIPEDSMDYSNFSRIHYDGNLQWLRSPVKAYNSDVENIEASHVV